MWWQALLLLVGFLGILLALMFSLASSSLKRLHMMMEKSYENLDTYLLQRYEMTKDLLELGKEAAPQECKAAEKVILNQGAPSNVPQERAKSEGKLANATTRLIVVLEPRLKEEEQFQTLKELLEDNEEDVYQAKKYYNQVVKHYNNKIRTFPSRIIAAIKKYKKAPYYDMEDPDKNRKKR
jgi:LemA protein